MGRMERKLAHWVMMKLVPKYRRREEWLMGLKRERMRKEMERQAAQARAMA